MMESRKIWFKGKIVPLEEAKINVLAPTSQYGLNVFEGIRCYWNEQQSQLYIFRLEDHLKRLFKSCKLLSIDCPYTKERIKEAIIETIKANKYKEDISIRLTIFADGFYSWASTKEFDMFISPVPKKQTNPEYNKTGLKCCISSWKRIDENSLSPRIKCGANYINSRMAQLDAISKGFDTTIFLNKNGNLAEGPGSCLFIIKNKELITPLFTDGVLESITRDSVIDIAKQIYNLEVSERSIDRTELYNADEAFLCGSAMEITKIDSVDAFALNYDENSITSSIHSSYLDIVRGNNLNYINWLTKVY